MFDKNFLLAGKSITKEEDRIKKKNRAKGKGTKGVFLRKRDYTGLDLNNSLMTVID